MNERTAAAENAIDSSAAGRGATILIVEDCALQAELLCRALEGAGYQVIIAGDDAADLTLARTNRPAAVVSDINMPLMDGYAMCGAIRCDESLKTTPFDAPEPAAFDEAEVSLLRELADDLAFKEIERGRDTLYDAAVVDACAKIFAQKRSALST